MSILKTASTEDILAQAITSTDAVRRITDTASTHWKWNESRCISSGYLANVLVFDSPENLAIIEAFLNLHFCTEFLSVH